jgi:hypothetical protein
MVGHGMVSFLFSIVVELKPFRNSSKFSRLIEHHDVTSHEQSDFMENFVSAVTVKRALVVMYRAQYFCPILTTFRFSRYLLIQVLSVKFHENPSNESRADMYELMDRPTDVMKLIGVFTTYGNVPNSRQCYS